LFVAVATESAIPFGHRWNIQTPTHDVSPEEMQRLMEE